MWKFIRIFVKRIKIHNSKMVENNTKTAVEYCEETYPQTCAEFKKIQAEMYETFCKKQRNYGPGNISVGTSLETKENIK